LGRFEEGLAIAARIIGLDLQTKSFNADHQAVPGTTDAYLIAATILVERFRDLPTGNRVMAKLVEDQPADPTAWLVRARWNRQHGQLDLATEDLEKATALAPENPDVLFTAFEVALGRKDYVRAQGIVEQSLEMFCQERELNKSSMYRRVRKLNQKGSEFVELPRARLPQQYELSARGVTLRIPSNESAARIADLVRVLGC
jgi:tetratricopeptide (TPR) repeat protein